MVLQSVLLEQRCGVLHQINVHLFPNIFPNSTRHQLDDLLHPLAIRYKIIILAFDHGCQGATLCQWPRDLSLVAPYPWLEDLVATMMLTHNRLQFLPPSRPWEPIDYECTAHPKKHTKVCMMCVRGKRKEKKRRKKSGRAQDILAQATFLSTHPRY